MGKIIVVGTLAFDTIETPFGKVDRVLGGSAPFDVIFQQVNL